jgi:hypothetical protein
MKQIIDSAGNKILGLFKKDDGSIVSLDKTEYNKKNLEKQKADEIIELKNRIDLLEELIIKVLNK